ncbi:MAG TPA: DegT/DnrJ/EryC1/StrS family aminotransferase [Chitinophagaceae bacterium]|nr:DegT/DnrJ/EryC1/StrS family aminotransferase [Chitinophagaceae bacterium]HMZ46153.1 DegT/DnrJ/EryC1/StrS family aminotransferase [Chitinophagaceae bacterium]HNF29922.1 DegT/DnrJ/EryC1/StrS family aminotransferase [Chitinophagaceae bacterium]HNJ58044.1 DegT/DnrJ/EryC1/StrS family aminotransferase [Chitinophagaceae bacterium]HNL82012.1 DegT/DnrJ/EryC1/StrS family aminotransferase [Chitinophagaceae bacterium]
MQIPFSPPFINENIELEVLDALRSGWITSGPKVKALEQEVCNYTNAEACLCVNSATSAMMLVLHWYGVKKGDEVIVPAYTYCATALAVMHLGATPIMVDVEDDFNISVSKIKLAISSRTKAIMPVDFAGWPCNYSEINKLINEPEIKQKFKAETEQQKKLQRILVLSDAAHSFGAVYNNKKLGTAADITIFSFHAVKNLTTAEGGAICLNLPLPFNNNDVYATLRLWSLNGQTKDAFSKSKAGSWRYDIVYPGFKMNLPDVLAAIGLAQIKEYNEVLLKERKRVFDFYSKTFSNYSWAMLPPYDVPNASSSYHLYPLRIKDINEEQRDRIIEKIAETGVAVNVHFQPLPLLTVFKQMGYDINNFPSAYNNYKAEISLPIYPQLNNNKCTYIVDNVVNAIKEVLING